MGYVIEFIGEEGGYQTEVISELRILLQRVNAMRKQGVPCQYRLINDNKEEK